MGFVENIFLIVYILLNSLDFVAQIGCNLSGCILFDELAPQVCDSELDSSVFAVDESYLLAHSVL